MKRIDDVGNDEPFRTSRAVSVERQTPKTDFASKLKTGVETAAGVLAAGAAAAAPFIPGGPIVSAAVSTLAGVSQLASSIPNLASALGGSGSSNGSSGTINDSLSGMQADNIKMMELQIKMQRENTVFSTLSNILKVRHDTQKNSIGNIR